jgi:hypothetical protein
MTEDTQSLIKESKPKTAKKKSKANKEPRNSHGGRPRLLSSYWLEVLKDPKLRGKDRADAIRELERCQREEQREKERKRAAKAAPNSKNRLHAILDRDPNANAPTIADYAKNAVSAKPQAREVPQATPPEVADTVEPAPLTFDDVLEQIAEQNKQNKKAHAESVADMAKRIRDVPAEMDANTRRLIDRAWSKAH